MRRIYNEVTITLSVKTKDGSVNILSSLAKALQVLEAFAPERPELSTIDLSRLLDMDKSAVSRIVVTLRHFGYLQKNEQTNKYSLGSKCIDLGSRAMHRYKETDICDVSTPFLQELSHNIEEVVHLGVLEGEDVVTLRKFGGGQMVTVNTRVGGRYPAHSCSLGKVLLSGLSDAELDQVLASVNLVKRTPKTVTDLQMVRQGIQDVRRQGFAYEDEESFVGICCLAVPITDYQGHIIASISVTVPKQRGGEERMKELLSHLQKAGMDISSQIGGHF